MLRGEGMVLAHAYELKPGHVFIVEGKQYEVVSSYGADGFDQLVDTKDGSTFVMHREEIVELVEGGSNSGKE